MTAKPTVRQRKNVVGKSAADGGGRAAGRGRRQAGAGGRQRWEAGKRRMRYLSFFSKARPEGRVSKFGALPLTARQKRVTMVVPFFQEQRLWQGWAGCSHGQRKTE